MCEYGNFIFVKAEIYAEIIFECEQITFKGVCGSINQKYSFLCKIVIVLNEVWSACQSQRLPRLHVYSFIALNFFNPFSKMSDFVSKIDKFYFSLISSHEVVLSQLLTLNQMNVTKYHIILLHVSSQTRVLSDVMLNKA